MGGAFWARVWLVAVVLLDAGLYPVRAVLRLTRDGLLFILLALACAVGAAARTDVLANVLLLLFLVLVSLLCSSYVLGGVALRRLRFSRRFPERVFAGEPVGVILTISNPARLPATGLLIVENLRPAEPGVAAPGPVRRLQPLTPPRGPEGALGGESFATVVAGRDRERTQYILQVRRRGIYQFAETRLSTVFPFGFWRTHRQPREPGRLVVYPRLGEIEAGFFQEVEQAFQRVRRFRPSREEHEFRGLRDFRYGDQPKWIHWRYSAHRGELQVKEFEQPQAHRVLLFLDTNLQRVGAQRLPAFELAISFAATAARELARRGSEVICVTHPLRGPLEWLTVSRERRNLDQLFEVLAGLRPDNTRTLADARAFVPREGLRHAYILVLGLGSLRLRADLAWLPCPENVVKVLDVRGEEFRRLFRRSPLGAGRGDWDEDLLPLLADEPEDAAEREPVATGD